MTIKALLSFAILLCSGLSLSAQVTVPPPATTPNTADLDYRKDGSNYLLVLKVGQPVIASLNAFMEREKLPGAYFSGIGAVKNAEVAYYNIAQRKYIYKKFDSLSMEVLSLNGNMGYFDKKPIIHAHIAMSDAKYEVHGGHLKEAEVSLLLEIFIIPTSKPITREWNKDFPELRTMTHIREN